MPEKGSEVRGRPHTLGMGPKPGRAALVCTTVTAQFDRTFHSKPWFHRNGSPVADTDLVSLVTMQTPDRDLSRVLHPSGPDAPRAAVWAAGCGRTWAPHPGEAAAAFVLCFPNHKNPRKLSCDLPAQGQPCPQ